MVPPNVADLFQVKMIQPTVYFPDFRSGNSIIYFFRYYEYTDITFNKSSLVEIRRPEIFSRAFL